MAPKLQESIASHVKDLSDVDSDVKRLTGEKETLQAIAKDTGALRENLATLESENKKLKEELKSLETNELE